MEKVEKIGKKIAKILLENNCRIVVDLKPKNLFTKIFRRIIKFQIDIKVIETWHSSANEKPKS